MSPQQVHTALLQILTLSRNDSALSALFCYCASMAKQILQSYYWRNTFTFERAGMSIDDVAALSVEELFLPRGTVQCHELRTYFGSQDVDPVESPPEEIVLSLRKIVSKKVSQTVSEIIGQTDTAYRKIHRSVVELIRGSTDWKRKAYFHDDILFRLPEDEANLHAPEIPHDELLVLMHAHAQPDDEIESVLHAIFEQLEHREEYKKAVSLVSLCNTLREFYTRFFAHTVQSDSHDPEYAHDIDAKSMIDQTANAMRQGMLSGYLRSGQIGDEDIQRIETAIRSMLSDLVAKEPRRLFDYYHEQFPEFSYIQYRANGRARFEYIMQQSRDRFLRMYRDGS
jgi:hypothetical protein